jgi:uncharacterized protein (DUF1800 family)
MFDPSSSGSLRRAKKWGPVMDRQISSKEASKFTEQLLRKPLPHPSRISSGIFRLLLLFGLACNCLACSSALASSYITLTASNTAVRMSQTSTIAITAPNVNPSKVLLKLVCLTSTPAGCGVLTGNIYKAPATIPMGGVVAIEAQYPPMPALRGLVTLTILNPAPEVASVSPASITSGTANVTLTGSGFIPKSTVAVTPGSLAGVKFSSTYVNSTTLTVKVTLPANFAGLISFQVTNPAPGTASSVPVQLKVAPAISYDAAVRFLRQSTFGPTTALIAHVQSVGFQAFLNEQFVSTPSLYATKQWWQQQRFSIVRNQVMDEDQLRQRMSMALSEIIVASEFGQTADQSAFPIWLNTLQNDAFGTYAQVLQDTLKQPALNAFLTNIGNNATTSPTQHVSQNLGRELLQLFTIGPYLLNIDGTNLADSQGNPRPAYDNTVIDGVSRALTGWNYACNNSVVCMWQVPLAPVEGQHDHAAKILPNGITTSSGQTAAADMTTLVNGLVQHPNAAPFISRRLIQSFVTSNPSPAYVSRISQVFKNDGNAVTGNLKAVVQAILLDPEARAGDDPTVASAVGHIQEPALFVAGVMRAMQGTLQAPLTTAPVGEDSPGPWGAPDAVAMEYWLGTMSEQPLYSPSVFNFFSFNNTLPGSQVLAPEMQLQTNSSAVSRTNYVNDVLNGQLDYIVTKDLAWLVNDAASPDQLVADLNHYLTAGRLDSNTIQTVITAVTVIPTNNPIGRIHQAAYLILSSPHYQVIQ